MLWKDLINLFGLNVKDPQFHGNKVCFGKKNAAGKPVVYRTINNPNMLFTIRGQTHAWHEDEGDLFRVQYQRTIGKPERILTAFDIKRRVVLRFEVVSRWTAIKQFFRKRLW